MEGFIASYSLSISISERLFGKAWREHYVVLYEDSSVIWEDMFITSYNFQIYKMPKWTVQ